MIKLIDISFYASNECNDLAALAKEHEPALAYVDHIKQQADIQVIKHLNAEGAQLINGIKYSGFKSSNSFWHIPFKTLDYIKKENPDVVIVQGLVFPLQVIWLSKKLGREKIILVQHHGETPFGGIKKYFQKMADRFITGYLFTSSENTKPWVQKNIIKDPSKCFELLEASTNFKKQDKPVAKKQLGLDGNYNFLWVGRLNAGKDPVTVINAFKRFCHEEPAARLYMFYQTKELLLEIKKIIEVDQELRESIILKGSIAHEELECWYNATDFYISGSHHESTGYALLEAMACGCIPVVTAIPSFNKITVNGAYGILYEAGNANELLDKMKQLHSIDRNKLSNNIATYFQEQLSFRAIAGNLYFICTKLTGK